MRFVGNTMIDTLVALEERIRERGAAESLGLQPGSYLLVTLHRPALVDGPLLGPTMERLSEVGQELPVLFPVHPRTRKMLDGATYPGVTLTDPVGYLDFLSLEADAGAVLTDSGGIQEETTYLGIPCFTLRDNTERPVTIRAGTNTLLGLDPERIYGHSATCCAPATGPAPGRRRRRALIGGTAGRPSGSPMSLSIGSFRGSGVSEPRSARPSLLRPLQPGGPEHASRRPDAAGDGGELARQQRTSPARSCSPSRRATGSPTTSSSALNTTFVTPIDGEDIYGLATQLDDIVDHIEESADFMGLYRIEAPMDQALAMTDVLVKSCEQLAVLLEHLRGFKDLEKYWIEIHRLENDGDRLFRDALASLFANGIDPMVVIRWRDIFLRLERAIDATEAAAHILEGIVIKNA